MTDYEIISLIIAVAGVITPVWLHYRGKKKEEVTKNAE